MTGFSPEAAEAQGVPTRVTEFELAEDSRLNYGRATSYCSEDFAAVSVGMQSSESISRVEVNIDIQEEPFVHENIGAEWFIYHEARPNVPVIPAGTGNYHITYTDGFVESSEFTYRGVSCDGSPVPGEETPLEPRIYIGAGAWCLEGEAIASIDAFNDIDEPVHLELNIDYQEKPYNDTLEPGYYLSHNGETGMSTVPDGVATYVATYLDGEVQSGELPYDGGWCEEGESGRINPFDDEHTEPGTGGPEHTIENVETLAGPSRIETAVAVSQEVYPEGAEHVVLATGYNFPDALAGAPLADALRAPLLLTGSEGLHDAAAAEITRLGATRVVLLGGEAALSAQVSADLEAMGVEVERLAGEGREATSVAIANRIASIKGPLNDIVVVEGGNFYDANIAGSLAGQEATAVVLTNPDHLTPVTGAFLSEHSDTVSEVMVVDSEFTLSDAVEVQAAQTAAAGLTQYGTGDRYTTSAQVAEAKQDRLNARQAAAGEPLTSVEAVHVATGHDYPDALTASAVAAAPNHVLLLVNGQARPETVSDEYSYVRTYLEENKTPAMQNLIFYGGENAITSANKSVIAVYANAAEDNSQPSPDSPS